MKKISLKSLFSRAEPGSYDLSVDDDALSSRAAFVQVIKVWISSNSFNLINKNLQIGISLLASLSVISSGMGLGYPAITTQLLLRDSSDLILTASQVSWFASVTAIVCPIGGPLSGFTADRIGRRNSMMLMSIVALLSWIVIGFSSRIDVEALFIQLLIGRAIIGIVIGMTTAPIVMYVSEVCHPALRGRMTMLSSPFFTATGLLTIYFLGYLIPVSLKLQFQT